MATSPELVAQIAAHQLQLDALHTLAAAAKAEEKETVIAELIGKILDYGLVPFDLFPADVLAAPKRGSRASVTPKYKDPATKSTWSGRGRTPIWLAGKDKDQFLIPQEAAALQ